MSPLQANALRGVLARYFLVSYVAVLINTAGYLRLVEAGGLLTVLFVAAVYLTYSFFYLLPAFVPALAAAGILSLPGVRRSARPSARRWIVLTLAVVGTSLLHVLLYADRVVFDLYGFHFNGFVWNLVFTRGGIESLGGSRATIWSFAAIIAAFVVMQTLLLAVVVGLPRVGAALSGLLRFRRVAIACLLFIAAAGFERIAYGISNLRGYRPVLAASGAFPLYLPTTLAKLARSLGMEVARQSSPGVSVGSLRTAYPLHAVKRDPAVRPPNIVWLVSESLRADMVEPEIMPHTWKLAQEAVWCRQHYSGGNGTRMGIFSMFYGLYGCFWFPIFEEQRSPVLMDVLQQAGYQMEMFTSASFTYPEFDRTMFVNVPKEKLHESDNALQWQRDQDNVTDLLKFIDGRDAARPFMTFMFFESPHAPYHFPESAAIRSPYAEEINYATMDLKNIGPMKNRYINSCHYLDSQLARVLTYLREHHLMESTVVLITGDHGEQFMEKGRWGHNSGFTEEETRAPLVLWAPGIGQREITRLTSHLDIPATLLRLVGVTNPPQDFSLGYDLLGDTARDFTVICDWYHVAYVDERYKVVLPFKTYGFAEQVITTREDGPVNVAADSQANPQQRVAKLMAGLRAFSR